MDVKEAVANILDSEQNANSIVDLIRLTQVQQSLLIMTQYDHIYGMTTFSCLFAFIKVSDKTTAARAINGLCEVFSNWLEHYYERFTITSNNDQPSVTVKFNKWVKEKYSLVKKCLIELLIDEELQVY